MSNNVKVKIPIILYEEPKPGEPANPIPYIEVGKTEEMPKVLFISEYKETGEFEVETQFGSAPIVDMTIHQFVSMTHLKKALSTKTFDKVRTALGLMPLKDAKKHGESILDKVFKNAENKVKKLEDNKNHEREQRAFTLGEDLRQKAQRFLEEEEKKE